MTAEVADLGIGKLFWKVTNGTQQVSNRPRVVDDIPGPTLGKERTYKMRSEVVHRLLDLAPKAPNVQAQALVRAMEWILSLPDALPNPFVAIGDDGSVSIEWDVAGNSLHITFEKYTEEVYFFSTNGEEWESSLDAVDKVSAALRIIALASLAQR